MTVGAFVGLIVTSVGLWLGALLSPLSEGETLGERVCLVGLLLGEDVVGAFDGDHVTPVG